MTEFAPLGAEETRLDGASLDAPAATTGDAVDRRIFWLVRHSLRKCAIANGGWDQLYVDPRDGRYWELTFPQGSLHGGGPRRLMHLAREEAERKYTLPPAPG